MAFKPSSTITLCKVPFDSSYKHVIYFRTASQKEEYFETRKAFQFTEYLTVRRTTADGSIKSSVKVNFNIDKLYGCNYMYYMNENHGDKIFYAFITQLVYVNEETTEIIFETDVFQTWFKGGYLEKSFVVREHSETDEIGDNLVPEKFNIQNYLTYEYPEQFTNEFGKYQYLIGTSNPINLGDIELDPLYGPRGQFQTGIYQGLYFYTYRTEEEINNFLDTIEEEQGDCVVFIALIPQLILRDYIKGIGYAGMVGGDTKPTETEVSFDFDFLNSAEIKPTDKGYTYKNNKLYTYPFYKLVVTNHSGQQAEYSMEDFADTSNATFRVYGDISANPSITMIPINYKGIEENIDCGISIQNFPQCAFNSDTYKLWLAKNQYSIGLDVLGGFGSFVGGLAMTATGGGAVVGAGMMINGATQMLNSANTVYQASREPNKVTMGAPRNNLLTAMKRNRFDFQIHYLRYDQAKFIDDYFTLYGYQTNKVKDPNIDSRPCFNYVQTINVNLHDSNMEYEYIPDDDIKILKSIFDNGVTLWNGENLLAGKYEMYKYGRIDNRPIKEGD